jgi:hypothetical protein
MDQTDIDKDWIWDICDEKDDRYIESNRWFFIGLIITIVIIFLVLIWSMVTKLEKNKK